MTMSNQMLARAWTALMLLIAAPVVFLSLAAPAMAQASGMAGIGESDTIALRATVTAIDQQSRMVTLVGPQGNSLTMKVGDQVRNLAQVKQGDTVIVHYHGSVAYVLAPPGTKLPGDALTAAGGRAAPGQTPAGAAAAKLVVTGTVVGVDPTSYTLQLVNPSGGPIRTLAVTTPQGRKTMHMVKVGDTITAVITEAVAVAVEPAS